MRDLPSINQVSILGQITNANYKLDRTFRWIFKVTVYREYGPQSETDTIEAEVTCGVGGGGYEEMMQNARIGDWVSVQGKIRWNGFIQVRSMCVFQKDTV